MNAVGVLGGSFDPVHRGHLALASHARRVLGLERVLLLPCAEPPHKQNRALAAVYHRIEMLHLALEGWEGLGLSTFEIERGGVRYTIDTLRALRSGPPPLAPVFLCGSDALAEIASWRDHEALLAEFDFATVDRPDDAGDPTDAALPKIVRAHLSALPPPEGRGVGLGGRVFRLQMPALAVSSSLVRARWASGRVSDDLVPVRVARYIQRHRLYTEEAPR